MVRSRRGRSRRAALEAARRQGGDGWRSTGSRSTGSRPTDGGARGVVLALIAIALVGVGFALGRWTARRSTAEPEASAAAAAMDGAAAPAPMAPEVELLEDVLATDLLSLAPAPGTEAVMAAADLPAEPAPLPELAPASEHASPVAIVIDDLGRSVEVIEELRRFGVPLTYAVLPFETRTAAVAARLAELGEQVLCHLPMEAERGENPGPGALVETMSEREIREATRLALDAVPNAVGVNNHMGSAFSADPAAMSAVLSVVRKRGLFFLDSRTSAASVGYTLAREAGIPTAERKVFLDGDRTHAAIRRELRRLLALANRGEPAIAIGHPYPETLGVLAEEIPRAREKGYRFVRISELVPAEPTDAAAASASPVPPDAPEEQGW
jgi:polysaccharide deacetylase 2 family uncharacterized protein YibQ